MAIFFSDAEKTFDLQKKSDHGKKEKFIYFSKEKAIRTCVLNIPILDSCHSMIAVFVSKNEIFRDQNYLRSYQNYWILWQCLPCIFLMRRPQKLSLGAIVSWDQALEIFELFELFFSTKSSKNGLFFFLTQKKSSDPKNSRTTNRKKKFNFSKETSKRTCIFKHSVFAFMPWCSDRTRNTRKTS